MSDFRRTFVTCVPIASVLLLTAGWKLATLEPAAVRTRYDDPVGRARQLYATARDMKVNDPPTAIELCDEAIALIDSARAAAPEPEPGKDYELEELETKVVQLKLTCR